MTGPTPEQLHHLVNRAIDGVALHGEGDHLRRLVHDLEQRADRAEAAIERVRAWIVGEPVTARSEFGSGYREALSDITDRLDEQQPTTTEVDSCAKHAVLTAAIGYPVRCPHCDPDAAPVPATHWTKHLIRHHPEQPTA